MTDISAQAAPGPRPGSTRWGRWLLIVSLAFNVLVIGAMVGRAYHFRHGAAVVAPVGGGPNLVGFVGTLTADRRATVWTSTGDERRALRPLRASLREARAVLREALATEPFDAQRVDAANAKLIEAEVALRAASQRLITRIASILTPEERRRFATHIAGEGFKGPRRGPPAWLRELQEPEDTGPPPPNRK
jgi:uncharacterized membrane protein